MKNHFFLLIFLLISCKSSHLNLGEEINFNSEKKIFLPTLNFSKYEKINIKNVEYLLAVNELNKIIYISSKDENFRTSNLSVNSVLKEITNFKDSLKFDSAWGAYYIKVNKDWYAGFKGEELPNEESKIAWFFKYDFPENKGISKSLLKKLGNGTD